MGKSMLLAILLATFVCSTIAAEKVLFGEPAPIAAEGRKVADPDAAKDTTEKSGRQSRVLLFPGNKQDSRTHQNGYVISSPYDTDERYNQAAAAAVAAAEDENRLLNFLPSFGENGMQVGLDFKLPFFSIPYGKMLSALSAPSIGGSLFGGNSPFGSSVASGFGSSGASGFGSSPANGLTSNLLGSGSGLATAAALAVTAGLLYPKITGLFTGQKDLSFRDGSADDFFQNMNKVLGQFNIDGGACMKVALCSLGNQKRQQRTRARDPSGATTTTPADVIEDILNLPYVKSMINKGGLVQARDFGGAGGDCDYFNAQKKCPVAAETFTKALSSLGG